MTTMNKNVRRFLKTMACGAVLLAGSMHANAKSLVITLSDGSLVYYYLGGDTKPVMRFDSETDGFNIGADNYEFAGVKNFYISSTDDPNGIELPSANCSMLSGGLLTILSKDAAVYTVDGKLIDVEKFYRDDAVTVNLNSLSGGIYVIKSGKMSFKIKK